MTLPLLIRKSVNAGPKGLQPMEVVSTHITSLDPLVDKAKSKNPLAGPPAMVNVSSNEANASEVPLKNPRPLTTTERADVPKDPNDAVASALPVNVPTVASHEVSVVPD